MVCEDSDEVRTNVTRVVYDFDDLLDWNRFSSFKKFVLTMAWMLRFIDNVKVSASQRKLHNEITLLEREKATSHVLRLLQRGAY